MVHHGLGILLRHIVRHIALLVGGVSERGGWRVIGYDVYDMCSQVSVIEDIER